MHPDRIAELLQPFLREANDQQPTATDAIFERISTYIDILERWNARINLTAIREPEEMVIRHFGESLFAARCLFPRVSSAYSASSAVKRSDSQLEVANDQRPTTNDRVADLGSGAGFPGIPIKLWAPNIFLTLIEASHKKATFLREVTRSLALANVDIQNVRAETILPASFDIVTLRAVERLAEVLPVAERLLAPNGRLALLIASPQLETVRSLLPNLDRNVTVPIPGSKSRVLLISQRGTKEVRVEKLT